MKLGTARIFPSPLTSPALLRLAFTTKLSTCSIFFSALLLLLDVQQKAKPKSICNIKGCNDPVSVSTDPSKLYKQCDKHGFRGAYQKPPKPSKTQQSSADPKQVRDVFTMRIGHHTFKSKNATALLISLVRRSSCALSFFSSHHNLFIDCSLPLVV